MSSSEEKITLSDADRHAYRAVTGSLPPRAIPATRSQLQATLEEAAQAWETSTGRSPEGRELAATARGFLQPKYV